MGYVHYTDSPIGRIIITGEEDALTGLRFEGQKDHAGTLYNNHFNIAEKHLPVFVEAERWLDLYFAGRDPGFIPKLAPDGTVFQKEIWEMLLTIPFGETRSYGDIASIIAGRRGIRSFSAQAVGGAVGRNPISLIIPCHRVVGADGSLTGYAGGLGRKEYLLKMERSL